MDHYFPVLEDSILLLSGWAGRTYFTVNLTTSDKEYLNITGPIQ